MINYHMYHDTRQLQVLAHVHSIEATPSATPRISAHAQYKDVGEGDFNKLLESSILRGILETLSSGGI